MEKKLNKRTNAKREFVCSTFNLILSRSIFSKKNSLAKEKIHLSLLAGEEASL